MLTTRRGYVIVLALAGFFTSISQAALLPAGSGLAAGGGVSPPPTGTIVGTLTTPFATADLTGTITTNVISGDLSNGFGGLTFIYSIHNSAASTDGVGRATVNDYTGVTVDATQLPLGSDVAPNLVNRSASGDVVGWNFQDINGVNTLGPGLDSALLVLRTDALNFAPNSASVIDGSSTSIAALGPAAGILPEPATLGLLGIAGVLIGHRRQRA